MAIQATKDMCYFCFDSLLSYLEGKDAPLPPSTIDSIPALIFVTWRQGHYEEGTLRGCRGCTSGPKPLPDQLYRYAISSASEDSRFDSIELGEISKLSCHVSILHSFEPATDHLDWIVGVHGITIDFDVFDAPVNEKTNKKLSRFEGHAIFLPGVASSNNWTQEITVHQLIRKAGYKGKIEMKNIIINTTRFQTSGEHTDYKAYIKQKKHIK